MKRAHWFTLHGFALCTTLLLAACGGRAPERSTDPAGRAFALVQEGRVRVVTSGFEPDARVLDAVWESLAREHGRRGLDLERADRGDTGAPRQVLATVDSELGEQLLRAAGGAPLEGGGFEYAARWFRGDLDLLRIALPDPERPGLPLSAWIANRPAALARAAVLCELNVHARFECYRAGGLALWGRVTSDGPRVEGDVDAQQDRWRRIALGRSDGVGGPQANDPVVVDPGDVGGVGADALASDDWVFFDHDGEAPVEALGAVRSIWLEPVARRVHRLGGALQPALDSTFDWLDFVARGGVDPPALVGRVRAENPAAADGGASGGDDASGTESSGTDPRRGKSRVLPAGVSIELPSEPVGRSGAVADAFRAAAQRHGTIVLRYDVAQERSPYAESARTWRDARVERDRAQIHDAVRQVASWNADVDLVLAPRLLATPSAGLLARAKRGSDAERTQFAADWAEHLETQARLAREVGARALLLGSNLPTITRTRLGDLERAAGEELEPTEAAIRTGLASAWKDGIGRARSIFDGELWYAAGDRGELDRIDFLDRLDAVAFELHLSLVDRGGQQRDAGFASGLVWLLEQVRAEIAGARLVVVTGMPAAADSTSDPRLPRGPVDESVQADFLDALIRTVGALDPPLDGLILDEWAVEPSRRGGRGYDLSRAALEARLAELFQALDDARSDG
jgi:hypothetical protein